MFVSPAGITSFANNAILRYVPHSFDLAEKREARTIVFLKILRPQKDGRGKYRAVMSVGSEVIIETCYEERRGETRGFQCRFERLEISSICVCLVKLRRQAIF